ncbi:DNA (cytosine-5-)-methyltransferase [Duganella sp. FT80W]|uniref:Cytosine-specific methyltransferase n=1 Tax=Duganella guangzhouensis TaxID=2666084 RepID=A0A6I2KWL9_9BURK|nr:DNA (cytosine-5-)-methyltransferase [Duganella guangzhouensis]MRW90181.1 DNA (cytosine-5-)-methyltransferase [Duganella guangzhouensis]
MAPDDDGLKLLKKVLEIYDQKYIAEYLNIESPDSWSREKINRWLSGKASPRLSHHEYEHLQTLLPKPPASHPHYDFDFIDLFAGIGGIRRGFEEIGGRCVFTSEWNPFAVRTYKANHYSDPNYHAFNDDIRKVTWSNRPEKSEAEAYKYINEQGVPDHDVLLAGFPCQPFSIAGVSKKNSLGRKHGFEDETQGTLFFDVARIIAAKQPAAFVLENVKNLKSHDKGNTFRTIMKALDELGYWVADSEQVGTTDYKIIDGSHFVPQHRERIVLVGFRKDLNIHDGFTLKDVSHHYPPARPTLTDILEDEQEIDPKYILTENLWRYLFNYSIKHKAKGNGFGYGLVKPDNPNEVTRTLSARYHKDGSEILIDRGFKSDLDFDHKKNIKNRPRRLTPSECSRLMGYDRPGESNFKIPVSDTQAYKQFGNSVVVGVFAAVAKLMKSRILQAKRLQEQRRKLAA